MSEVCPIFHNGDYDWGWDSVPIHREPFDRIAHVHVTPCNDLKAHQMDPTCWCKPFEDLEGDECGHPLWVHNALDQRERYEYGKPLN